MKPILQVEDDANDVFFLNHAMKKAGMANPVHVAVDGQQAIDYLKGIGKFADRELFPLPCLVLLDLKLPYVMGLEVLAWIRSQRLKSIVVIILSASAENTDVAAAYRLGANAFLTKPAEANKLESIVKAIKDFWLMHNVLPQELPMEKQEAPRLPTRLGSTQNRKKPLLPARNGRSTTPKQWAGDNVAAERRGVVSSGRIEGG
jgi:CheY-like chemotaxis protein